MSDLRDLPDLASDVRERVVTPPYDAVSRRVRARRLRGAAGSVAAAVLVVGGVSVWQNVATTAGPPVPQPAEKTPIPPTDESQWQAVVNGTDAHPFDASGTDDGSVAVVWRAVEQPAPTFALVIRQADGAVHGIRLDAPVELTPVPGGWVGLRTAQGFIIGSDGTWTDLGSPRDAREPRAGDVFVNGQFGRWLYSPTDRSWSIMPPRYGDLADGYVTPVGYLVTCGSGPGGVRVSDPSRPQAEPSVPGSTCVMAGRGHTVAVAGLGDDPDGGIPLTGMILKNGDTWTHPRFENSPVDDVVSLIVVPDGRALVTDSDGDAALFGGDETVVELRQKAGAAFVAGDRVYLTAYGQAKGPLVALENDLGWEEAPLPGMESSEE